MLERLVARSSGLASLRERQVLALFGGGCVSVRRC
jgi:hypothetical protein